MESSQTTGAIPKILRKLCASPTVTDTDIAQVVENLSPYARDLLMAGVQYLGKRGSINAFGARLLSNPAFHKYFKTKLTVTLVSWNVNSLRARILDDALASCKKQRIISPDSPMGQLCSQVDPDIICLQETKCTTKTLGCVDVSEYHSYWNCASKAGYSGVSIWSKQEAKRIDRTLPGLDPASSRLQDEGRIITAYYESLVVVNTYTPNTLRAGVKPKKGWAGVKEERSKYIRDRINWDTAMAGYLKELCKSHTRVIWVGDMNVARTLLDLHEGTMSQKKLQQAIDNSERPSRIASLQDRVVAGKIIDELGGGAGYRLEERRGLETIIEESSLTDAYRYLYPSSYGFTYWDLRRGTHWRKANNGMRIDYAMVSQAIKNALLDVTVHKSLGEDREKLPSDHAPLVVTYADLPRL